MCGAHLAYLQTYIHVRAHSTMPFQRGVRSTVKQSKIFKKRNETKIKVKTTFFGCCCCCYRQCCRSCCCWVTVVNVNFDLVVQLEKKFCQIFTILFHSFIFSFLSPQLGFFSLSSVRLFLLIVQNRTTTHTQRANTNVVAENLQTFGITIKKWKR